MNQIMDNNVHNQQAYALDNLNTAVMLVDSDLRIIYLNRKSEKLLAKLESEFRKRWPDFRGNKEYLLGQCIDQFHQDPSHQRRLLSSPDNLPYESGFVMGDTHIRLSVSPRMDEQGNYLGATLEWYDITEKVNTELEVGRLISAVRGMTTNLMMADPEGKIIFMNPAVEAMFRKREAKLREALPHFNVDTIIGSNMDLFHKHPEKQKRILKPENLPYSTNIEVAGLHFKLTAMALFDSKGNHIGSAVEWVDTTDVVMARQQVEKIVNLASHGNLGERIDTTNFDGFMQSLSESINELLDAVEQPIRKCREALNAVAEGDLNKNMGGEYDGIYGELQYALNKSIENIRGLITEIYSVASAVASAADEISRGNTDLSQRTEESAANMEETAASMEELTVSIKENTDGITEAKALGISSTQAAEEGEQVVLKAVDTIEEINKSSKQIESIVGVMDDIAFQTNLLALNAAVEAARAGEQGKGFAVVASEVRKLAQRSADSAKEIKKLIEESVEQIEDGTLYVKESGEKIGHIKSAIEAVSRIISDVANASVEQASGIEQVNKAVSEMESMTQENAALVEEAAAASESLIDQANSLVKLMDFFKLDSIKNGDKTPQAMESPAVDKGAPLSQLRSSTSTLDDFDNDGSWEEF